jgi:hypothetical protein
MEVREFFHEISSLHEISLKIGFDRVYSPFFYCRSEALINTACTDITQNSYQSKRKRKIDVDKIDGH